MPKKCQHIPFWHLKLNLNPLESQKCQHIPFLCLKLYEYTTLKINTEETSLNCEAGSGVRISIVPELEKRDLDLGIDEEFEGCTNFLQLNPTSYFMSFENSPLYDSYDHEDQGDRTVDVHGDSENVTLLGEKGYQSDNIYVPLLVDENHNAGLVSYEEDKVCNITPAIQKEQLHIDYDDNDFPELEEAWFKYGIQDDKEVDVFPLILSGQSMIES
jgi:hypothetical protein